MGNSVSTSTVDTAAAALHHTSHPCTRTPPVKKATSSVTGTSRALRWEGAPVEGDDDGQEAGDGDEVFGVLYFVFRQSSSVEGGSAAADELEQRERESVCDTDSQMATYHAVVRLVVSAHGGGRGGLRRPNPLPPAPPSSARALPPRRLLRAQLSPSERPLLLGGWRSSEGSCACGARDGAERSVAVLGWDRGHESRACRTHELRRSCAPSPTLAAPYPTRPNPSCAPPHLGSPFPPVACRKESFALERQRCIRQGLAATHSRRLQSRNFRCF